METIATPTRLLSRLQKESVDADAPLKAEFTASPAWLKKAGTVALALPGVGRSESSDAATAGAKAPIAKRDGTSWRPSSLFGGFWGGEAPDEPLGKPDELFTNATSPTSPVDDGEEEGEGTLKAEKGAATVCAETSSVRSSPGNRSRLSTLFTDWIAPEPAPATTSPSRRHTRIVGEPIAVSKHLSRRFSSFVPEAGAADASPSLAEYPLSDGDIDIALEELMVRESIPFPLAISS